jgi:sugar lactone lactonase YvrE
VLATLLDGLTFTEGPRWHDGRLWFSDFYTQRVLAVTPEGRLETILEVPQRPSGLGWLPDGTLLVVSMLDRQLLRVVDGKPRRHADLASIATAPCNDMVVDSRGRAYVGNFGFDRHRGEPPRAAAIARVDPDGVITRAAEDLEFPNGTVIIPDGRTLVVAETLGQRLTAFDVAADGALTKRRVWAKLDGVFPDGICLDAEGAIWVSDARGPDLLRVREGGAIERRIPTGPGRHAFACMLGGTDRRTLYVCTCTGSGPAMADKRDGRIETVRVDVPGAGLP